MERRTVAIAAACLFGGLALQVQAQDKPPMPMGPILGGSILVQASPTPPKRQVDHALLRKQSEELATLASSLPLQVDQVKQGLLPKDLQNRLSRIEKLAKQIRKELQP